MVTGRTAIIDVGGGYRSIFGAGILDRCLEDGIDFDRCYGVSAGSANLASFLAGQKGRLYRFYLVYSSRKAYAGAGNFFTDGNYINLDYVYGTLSKHDGEYPLDYPALAANPAGFTIVACNGNDGSATYFDKSDIRQDDYDVLKASSSVPVANKPYMIGGVPYFDGGLADPIPVQKALDDGCERIVLVLTRPKDYRRTRSHDAIPARILSRSYPKAGERLMQRYKTYNDELALARRLEKDGRVMILAPDQLYGLDTLHKSREGLTKMYRRGYRDAKAIAGYLKS